MKINVMEKNKRTEHSDLVDLTASVEEMRQFKSMIYNISARFVSLSPDKIEREIEEGLKLIVQFLAIDRADMWELDKEKKKNIVAYSYASPGVPSLDAVDVRLTFPWAFERILKGKVLKFSHVGKDIKIMTKDREFLKKEGIKSFLTLPLKISGLIVGAIAFVSIKSYRTWTDELVRDLSFVGEIFANAIQRKLREESLQLAFDEIKTLKEQLEEDCTYLRQEIAEEQNFQNIIGRSNALRDTLSKISPVASTDTTVLISGETGTGKELFARAIHEMSPRKNRPLVKADCAALSANLIESELFGHERGAFTGAGTKREGRFELAHNTTLFLDEIGEIPLDIQAKLLRLLQEGEFERLGSSRTIKVDVRIVAATNRNLEFEVEQGRFRRDLWYRLNVFPIKIPPLRERREDISLLANHFADKYGRKMGKVITRIPHDLMKKLERYQWPGNIRELENVIERAVIVSLGPTLQLADKLIGGLPENILSGREGSLSAVERAYIIKVLEQTHWKIHGPNGAAQILGLNPSTLRSRMKKLQIKKTFP
jgi:formate hydrogenlyase transcriptional activator